MNKYYLAYGMNTSKASMKHRCPEARSLGKVVLPDHSLAFRGVCDIVKTPGTDMECALWTITDACEHSLDQLEGYPNFYSKKEVEVMYNGHIIQAMIYYMVNTEQLGFPGSYYLQMVADGYYDHNIDLEQISQALKEVQKLDESYLCI